METLLPQTADLNDGATGGDAENVLEGWKELGRSWIVDFLGPLAEFPGALHSETLSSFTLAISKMGTITSVHLFLKVFARFSQKE